MEACWAHNPEVRGSKPRSANKFFFFFLFQLKLFILDLGIRVLYVWPFLFVCLFVCFFLKKICCEIFTANPKVNRCHNIFSCNICCLSLDFIVSRVVQWKRAGPITKRS